jgi:hypothetical protein
MHYEANVVPNTLAALTGGSPYILNGNNSATGNVTWAFQWDLPIAPGATSQFSKDISMVVPEPSTVALVGVSLISMLALRRRRA